MKKEFTLNKLMTAYNLLKQISVNSLSPDLRAKILTIRVKYNCAIKQYNDEKDIAGKEATSEELKGLSDKADKRTPEENERFEMLKSEFEETMSSFINSKLDAKMEQEFLTKEEYEELKLSAQPESRDITNGYGMTIKVYPEYAIEELYFYFVE